MAKKLKTADISDEFIIRFLNGKLKKEEIGEMEQWISSTPENLELFETSRQIWLGSAATVSAGNFDAQSAWEKIQGKLHNSGNENNVIKPLLNTRRLWRALQIAATAMILVTVGVAGSWIIFASKKVSIPEKYCEIFAPQGSKSQITLPDGSTAWINAGSKLSYKGDFNLTDRVVNLEGEGYFDVATNKAKPFIVQTAHLNVKAFGTVFNVKAYPEEETVEATLVEGIVEIESRSMDKSDETYTYTLKPKQNIIYHIESGLAEQKYENVPLKESAAIKKTEIAGKEVQVISNIKPELYTSWKDENWVIEGMPLEELATLMGRRYNSRIEIRDDALKLYKFTGTIQNETLEQVMMILSLTTPLEYSIGKGSANWMLNRRLEKNYTRILKR